MPSIPTASVILPTYNRNELLRETLDSLARQTYPSNGFEVIVVDDGSTDGTDKIAAETFPFTLRYFGQSNQGDAAARNFGAQQSQADILVFLDDDILVAPGYLSNLIQGHDKCQNRIVVGTWNLWQAESTRLAQTLNTMQAPGARRADSPEDHDSGHTSDLTHTITELPFRDVESNNMSLLREAYFKIGMMQSLDFSGSSMWCDLDFAYRAYRKGFEFRRSINAICWHRDHSARNLDAFTQRARTAAYRAVILFQTYPELITHLPMFSDKTPIIWGQDPARLMARKFVRSMASSRPALWSMEKIASVLDKRWPDSSLLSVFYRFIIGGYIFQGYRDGLREFEQVDKMARPILRT